MFRIRTRMFKVGYNFGRKVLCPLCRMHQDNQEGLLECIIIKLNCRELYENKDVKCEDIFSSNMSKLNSVTKLLKKCLEMREEILEERQQQQKMQQHQ